MTSFYVKSYNALHSVKKMCTSDECLRTSANLKLSMDKSVDPCEDFYEFSCGRWSVEHPNHGWYPKFSTFETIDERVLLSSLNFLTSNESQEEPLPVKQSRYFYKSCMDVESINNLGYSVIYKYLKEVGLPEIPSYFSGKSVDDDIDFDWIEVSVKLKQIFAMNLFIQFDIDADIYNRSNNVLYIGSGISSAPLPSPFKLKRKTKEMRKSQNADDDEDDFDVEEYLRKLEVNSKNAMKRIIEVVLNTSEMSIVNATTILNIDIKRYSIEELQKETDNFLVANNMNKMDIWKPYITSLFKEVKDVNFDFKNDFVYISPSEMTYICNILLYISRTPKVILELYNWWIVVKSMIINTTSDVIAYINKEMSIYYQNYPEVIRSRSLDCTELITKFMGIAVSYGIVDQTFENNTKPKVEQMLYDIKEAFEHRVNNIPWMDEPTKRATLEKSKEMLSFIGFPDWLMNKTAIEVHYENMTILPNTYLENMMAFIRTYTLTSLKTYRLENDRTWRTDPVTVNAFNYFGDNTINVPMAILTFPMYHLGLEVLNYGAIGSILGHELTHGFDNTGRRFDKYGNLIEWWTNETLNTFEDKTECFIKQYSDYRVPNIEMNVDGDLTLGENLADNGGLHHAFLAYQNYLKRFGPEDHLPGFDEYSNNQMFFIAYGSIWCESRNDASLIDQIRTDEHSPGKFRVLGTLQNSEDFSKAFNCPVGSNMNPERSRCRIW
ncbi:PREDICTED: neprilysin-11 [Nicrophorus vespilloides]|uniref:Neprilysin-11 n=1 Tax=Nicrophorus vespilloides TaxID=110193 RepID=A0ABM1MEG8_NICVS|nr:PREDICTED: neprilysin-11 [Nicrophorus vespilloides]